MSIPAEQRFSVVEPSSSLIGCWFGSIFLGGLPRRFLDFCDEVAGIERFVESLLTFNNLKSMYKIDKNDVDCYS